MNGDKILLSEEDTLGGRVTSRKAEKAHDAETRGLKTFHIYTFRNPFALSIIYNIAKASRLLSLNVSVIPSFLLLQHPHTHALPPSSGNP